MSWPEALLLAQVRRVDAPFPDTFALTLHKREIDGVLLIGLAREARGIGWLERRPEGRVDTPLLLRLKQAVEGGRIVQIERSDARSLRIRFERGDESSTLEAHFFGARGNARLRAGDGTVLASLRGAPGDDERPRPATELEPASDTLAELADLRGTGQRLLDARAEHALDQLRARLGRALAQGLRRVERRLLAVEGDRARADQAGALRRKASLVLANLHAMPRDCERAELLDYALDPPAPVVVDIDPALGAKRQAQAWFDRARKLERGATLAGERAHKTRKEIAALESLSARCATAESVPVLEALAREATERGVQGARIDAEPKASARSPKPARLPYREFRGSGSRAILVGRGPDDNDRLTLDHSRPEDLWLHVRDHAGAHVVVPLSRDEACPPDLLCDAATLAAHFSQARGQAGIDVIYTPRRYVRKPRKAAPGLVTCLREKVFRLELEAPRLKRLLESELPR